MVHKTILFFRFIRGSLESKWEQLLLKGTTEITKPKNPFCKNQTKQKTDNVYHSCQ